MALDSHFIPAFSIEDVLLDKDSGAPLSGGLVYFEHDNQRGVLKPVYQITGTSPNYAYTQLPNPMTLSSIGTFEDSGSNPTVPYFFPYDSNLDVDLYYVRVTSSEDVPQFDREAVPYIPDSGNTDIASAFVNELSNPQFAEVLFDTRTPDFVYTFNAASLEVVEIAPGWSIEVSCAGAGTVTVNQLTPVGSLNRLTNPGTILNITSAGLTRLRLRQRLYGSPNLWGSGYLAGTFVAKTYSGTDVTLTLLYSQSNGTVVDQTIVSATLLADGVYAAHPGSVLIPASTSTDDFPDAYVDIEFNLPLSVEIDITSVMIAGTGAGSVDNITYDQTSLDRQIDQLFHYYKVPLDFKAIPSMLTGWDFPVNPAQALGPSVTVNTTAAYAWDQTICQSVVGNVAVIRDAVTSGFQATTANAAEAFYQLQYLDGRQAQKILGTTMSVNINAFRTTAGGLCNVKVYLFRGNAASVFPTLPTSLGTIDALGVFTLTAANWTLIPRGNLGQASGVLSTVDTADYSTLNDVVDLQFNGWEVTDSTQISDTNKFAIVVTFACPTTGTVVTVNSTSLVPGDIPTRPAPQTFDESVAACQFYYEKSYDNIVVPGTSSTSSILAQQLSGAISRAVFASSGGHNFTSYTLVNSNFSIRFNTLKRTVTPAVVLYNATGSSGNVGVLGYLNTNGTPSTIVNTNLASTSWSQNAGSKGVDYFVNSQPTSLYTATEDQTNPALVSTFYLSGYLYWHYTADARLGVVA